MAGKIISIIFYTIAGFFLYGSCVISFFGNSPYFPYFIKIAITCGFSIPGLIALLIGLAIRRFRTWKRDIGIILLTSAGLTLMVVFTIFCMLLSSDFEEFFPRANINFFNDYLTGFSCIILLILFGILLLIKSKKSNNPIQRTEPAA